MSEERRLADLIIRHCAPTLANLKTANLFGYRYDTADSLARALGGLAAELAPRGIRFRVLHDAGQRALIYVYRARRLAEDLSGTGTAALLAACGYRCDGCEAALDCLARRIEADNGQFPHEIGLFLGYPFGDVKGFIENKGRNCKCTGCWKVYCDECEARRQFGRFEKCRAIYCRLYREGRTLSRLTVAA